MMKILATGPSGASEELQPLRDAGQEVVIGRPLDQPGRIAYTEADLIAAVRDVDVILASHLETISRGVMEAAPRLRLVIVPFIGTDKIDLAAATRQGVLVANSPTPENFIAVAEATIGLILMLLKRVKHNEAKLRRGEWAQRQDRGEFLFGKTVGLVGLGRVGSHVARRLVNWDVCLLASDPYIPMAQAEALDVSLVDLDTVLAESDVVSLHASLTDETRGLIGEKELRRMKPTAVLVNTTRGEMADEEALARAIGEGWIAGAAVDAFVKEPLPPGNPLRGVDAERLTLTPHNVSHSEAGRRANLRLAFEQILAATRGKAPVHCVNPEAIAHWRGTRWASTASSPRRTASHGLLQPRGTQPGRREVRVPEGRRRRVRGGGRARLQGQLQHRHHRERRWADGGGHALQAFGGTGDRRAAARDDVQARALRGEAALPLGSLARQRGLSCRVSRGGDRDQPAHPRGHGAQRAQAHPGSRAGDAGGDRQAQSGRGQGQRRRRAGAAAHGSPPGRVESRGGDGAPARASHDGLRGNDEDLPARPGDPSSLPGPRPH